MLKILQVDNKQDLKILRKVSKEVSKEEIESSTFQSFLDDLIHTAKNTETEEGYRVAGLAAIQAGKDIRAFCILNEDGGFKVMINPKIKVIKDELIIDKEACLSIPNRVGNVARVKKIKVQYLNRDGKKEKGIFSNWEAREILHEYDHLEGILFTDKLID